MTETPHQASKLDSLMGFLDVTWGIEFDSPSETLDHTIWLLVDLFLHEMVITTLHNVSNLHLQLLYTSWHSNGAFLDVRKHEVVSFLI